MLNIKMVSLGYSIGYAESTAECISAWNNPDENDFEFEIDAIYISEWKPSYNVFEVQCGEISTKFDDQNIKACCIQYPNNKFKFGFPCCDKLMWCVSRLLLETTFIWNNVNEFDQTKLLAVCDLYLHGLVAGFGEKDPLLSTILYDEIHPDSTSHKATQVGEVRGFETVYLY